MSLESRRKAWQSIEKICWVFSVHSDHLDLAFHVQNALDEDDIIGSSVYPEQAQASLDPVSQETEAVQPMGEEGLLKGELNNKKCQILMMFSE